MRIPHQTTPFTPKSTYSFRMTPARLARLTQNPPPPTSPKRKTRNTQTTQSPQPTSVQHPRHTVQSPSPPVTLSTTRSTPTHHTSQSSIEETATLTRYRQPSRFTTSISAIPRLTSQFLSALAGPLITPRNLTLDILRTLLRDTSPSTASTPPGYTSTPSTSLTQTPPPPLNTLSIPFAPPHNIATALDSLLSYLIPLPSTHPLFPFRYFSTTTPESTQTDSFISVLHVSGNHSLTHSPKTPLTSKARSLLESKHILVVFLILSANTVDFTLFALQHTF